MLSQKLRRAVGILNVQRDVKFFDFIIFLVRRMPLLLDQHLSQNIPAIKLHWSKVLHQVNMLLSAVKKYHLQLQDFVRQEMEKTQLTAFYTSEELVFFLASGLLTLPIYLDDATGSFSLMPSTDAL
ncbi:hypothetical protein QQ045_018008 [Rhodiola kirilowii]